MISFVYNYFIISFLLFYSVAKLNSNFFKLNKTIFISALAYHLFLTALYFLIFYDQPADYRKYLSLKLIEPFTFTRSLSGTELIYNFIYLLKKILFFNDLIILLSFSLISYVGIMIFIKNLIKLGISSKIAYLLFFIPGIHFWTIAPGKDCLLFFFLSYFFYNYIDKKLFLSVLMIIFVFLIRPHVGVIFMVSIAATEFLLIKGYKKFLIFFLISIFFYFTFKTGFSSVYLTNTTILSDNIFMQMFSTLHIQSSKYLLTSAHYDEGNIFFNMFNYIVFPLSFLFKNNSLMINLSILIEILSIVFLAILVSKNKNNFKINERMLYFLCSCNLLYLILLPQVMFNFGLNVRQKWMIVPFLIYLIFLLKNLFVKLKKM